MQLDGAEDEALNAKGLEDISPAASIELEVDLGDTTDEEKEPRASDPAS